MRIPAAFACLAVLALSACASVGEAPERIASADAAATPVSDYAPIAYTAPPQNFCQGAVASDRLRLQGNGFDAPTIDRITLQSYQQCSALLARTPRAIGTDNLRLASR